MVIMIAIRLFIVLTLLFGCSKSQNASAPVIIQPPPPPPPPPVTTPDIRLLYVGNSLTTVNDLPSIVVELARLDSVNIAFKDMSLGNYSLEDHWRDGKIQAEIASVKYDFVVVQQGPSSLLSSQALLLEYVTKIKAVASTYSSNVCVYMVWPEKARLPFLDDVIYGYTQAAVQTQSFLAPGGLAWKKAWALDFRLPLYSSDDFHPSLMGSVLAALTVYGSIKQKKNFNFLSYDKFPWKTIKESDFMTLKQAALEALGY